MGVLSDGGVWTQRWVCVCVCVCVCALLYREKEGVHV